MALAVSVSTAQTQSPPLWRETLSEKVFDWDYTPLGSVLVQLDSGPLFALDAETGKHLWSRADRVRIVRAPGMLAAFATTPTGGAVVDLASGQDRWKTETLGFSSIKGAAYLPSRGLVLVYGVTAESPHVLVAVKYESGEVLWKQAALYASPDLAPQARKINYPAYTLDTDDTVVLAPTLDEDAIWGPRRAGLIRLPFSVRESNGLVGANPVSVSTDGSGQM